MDYPDYEAPIATDRLVTPKLVEKLTAGLEQRKIELNATDDDWIRLEQILQLYERQAAYWKGFPTMGQLAILKRAGKKASDLATELRALVDTGYDLIVQEKLGDQDLEGMMTGLQRLTKLTDSRSPKAEASEREQESRMRLQMAAELQLALDSWWQQATGTNPDVAESGDTPFTYFLSQVLRGVSGESPGASRSAIEQRRRWKRGWDRKSIAAAEKLDKLSRTQ